MIVLEIIHHLNRALNKIDNFTNSIKLVVFSIKFEIKKKDFCLLR